MTNSKMSLVTRSILSLVAPWLGERVKETLLHYMQTELQHAFLFYDFKEYIQIEIEK